MQTGVRVVMVVALSSVAGVALGQARDAGGPAAAGGPFVVPSVRWAHGIAGAADRIWVAGGNEGLLELAPGVPPARVTGPAQAVAIGASPRGVVVVADHDRRLHRVEGGRWTAGPRAPEGRFGDAIVAIALADDGRAFAASRYGGLHVWDARGLRTIPYGPGAPEGVGLAVTGDGRRAFVSGRDRMLLEVRDGQARRPGFADAAVAALHASYETFGALWVSPSSGRLWIGTSGRRLLEVDLASDEVRAHDVDLFGQMRVITGVGSGDTEVVIVGAQSRIGTLTGGAFALLPGERSFPEGLYVHRPSSTLFVANRDGVSLVALETRRAVEAPRVAVTSSRPTLVQPAGDAAPLEPPARGRRGGGVRIDDLRLRGCSVLAAIAIPAQAQAAARCLPPGGSVRATVRLRAGRASGVTVAPGGRAGACVERALRRLRAPGSCEAAFTLARP